MTQGLLGQGQSITQRIAEPGITKFVNNLTDPLARDIDKKGIDSLWKGPISNFPGLAEQLPAKIDPTTGQPVAKAASGPGILLGAKQDIASPLSIEASRLNKEGFSKVSVPKTYPQQVTIKGSTVNLSPDEQRAVTQLTGATLDKLSQRLDTPAYRSATDAEKAAMIKAWVSAADNSRTAAVVKVLGPKEVQARVGAGRNIAGQLVNQAQAPTADDFNFDPLGGLAQDQRSAQLAGAR